MKRFTFDEVTDFSDFFSGNNHEVTDAIVEGIKEAIEAEKDEAELFDYSARKFTYEHSAFFKFITRYSSPLFS